MNESKITVGDLTQMAVTMEEKGMHFYNWAANFFKDHEVKSMFIRLAEEEKDHVRIFKKLLESPNANVAVRQHAGKYLKMITESQGIFPNPSRITANKIKSPADALSIGIQAEKDAILFYQEMYNESNAQDVKDALSKLLEAEKLHLLELRDSMDELSGVRH